jgi:hypothetical protein
MARALFFFSLYVSQGDKTPTEAFALCFKDNKPVIPERKKKQEATARREPGARRANRGKQ